MADPISTNLASIAEAVSPGPVREALLARVEELSPAMRAEEARIETLRPLALRDVLRPIACAPLNVQALVESAHLDVKAIANEANEARRRGQGYLPAVYAGRINRRAQELLAAIAQKEDATLAQIAKATEQHLFDYPELHLPLAQAQAREAAQALEVQTQHQTQLETELAVADRQLLDAEQQHHGAIATGDFAKGTQAVVEQCRTARQAIVERLNPHQTVLRAAKAKAEQAHARVKFIEVIGDAARLERECSSLSPTQIAQHIARIERGLAAVRQLDPNMRHPRLFGQGAIGRELELVASSRAYKARQLRVIQAHERGESLEQVLAMAGVAQ